MNPVEAEMAVLGALMFDNDAIDLAAEILKPDHFAEPLFGWLFEHAVRMRRDGRHVDPITLAPIGEAWGKGYQELGGVETLITMVDRAPPSSNVSDYVSVIRDGYLRRASAELVGDHLKALKESARPAFDLIAEARRSLDVLEATGAPEESSLITAPDAARIAVRNMAQLAQEGRPRGLMTGLRCFDRRLGGLLPGKLLVVGGRPGMGKTGLLRNALHGAAVRNPNHLFVAFGIEMGPEELMHRELSAITHELHDGVAYEAMAKGTLTGFDFQIIDEAERRVPPNLILDDCPTLSLDDVRRKVAALRRRGKIGGIGIDYLQLMQKPEARGRNDAALLGEITMGLKQLSRTKGHESCVILLSQINRGVESRDDKRPGLADLRESGSIEQDADAVLFAYREIYYLQKAEPKTGKEDWTMRCEEIRTLMEVICAKQRGGPEGTDRQTYLAAYDHISDRAE